MVSAAAVSAAAVSAVAMSAAALSAVALSAAVMRGGGSFVRGGGICGGVVRGGIARGGSVRSGGVRGGGVSGGVASVAFSTTPPEGLNVHRRMTGIPQLELILSLSCCFSTICYRGVFDSGRVSLQQRDGAFSEVFSIPSSLQSIAIYV